MKELAQSFDGKRPLRRYKKIRRVKTERTMCYMNGTRVPRSSGSQGIRSALHSEPRRDSYAPIRHATSTRPHRKGVYFGGFAFSDGIKRVRHPLAIGTHRNRASVRVTIIPCSYVFVKHFFAIAKKKHPCCSICGSMKAGDGKISVHLRIFGNFPAYVAIADREE